MGQGIVIRAGVVVSALAAAQGVLWLMWSVPFLGGARPDTAEGRNTRVGTNLDPTLRNERDAGSHRVGFVKDYGTHRLWVVTWGELIDSLRMKFEAYRAELGLIPTTSTGVDYLRRAHAEYLPHSLISDDDHSDS